MIKLIHYSNHYKTKHLAELYEWSYCRYNKAHASVIFFDYNHSMKT